MIFARHRRNAATPAGPSPFLRIYFAMQSYLRSSTPNEEDSALPYHVKRQRLLLLVYAGLVAALTLISYVVSPASKAVLLGLMIPGGGFLYWAAGDQFAFAIIICAAGLGLFTISLILWFATGNVIAPVVTWIFLAAVSGAPSLLALNEGQVAPGWPFLLAPFVVAGLGLVTLRPAGPVRSSPPVVVSVPRQAAKDADELPLEDLQRLRLLLDRALQPVENFDGFEWRDQFQTAAVRYQVNFVAYAVALARQRHAPAADAGFLQAQQNLLTKIGDRRLWNYWRLENAWGNFRLDADPIPDQNIMYGGFTALQMALGGTGRDLVLHDKGRTWRRYGLTGITHGLAQQYDAAPYGLLACEPNWIYPLCNLITMAGIKAADARGGADLWPQRAGKFKHSLECEGMKANGDFIAFRSALTGIAPPTPGGIVMQAFPCLFLNSLAPDLAREHWRRIRKKLDTENWRRLFWSVDIGNYGFSRATSYAATGAAAAELGDTEIAGECLARLDAECPSQSEGGVVHRERASLWAHALEIALRSTRENSWHDLVGSPGTQGGPRLTAAFYPEVQIAKARADGGKLQLVLYPGADSCSSRIELGGLVPERRYRTGQNSEAFVKADKTGRAWLHVALHGRTAFMIEPLE